MSDDVADLGIKVDSSGVVKATKNLDKLDKQSGKNERSNDKLKKSFVGVKTAVTAVAASMVLKHFVSTAAAFETMKISLETVTGSAEKANIAFDGIKEFASNTPFSVEEVTQSFIKLKALGIEPTEANLRSFGNTSSAMGKSLNQMIEAVADAATGEFERLKEFGIKASKQGDDVKFTFQGVTTTVKNSSKEITGYLESIGETQFAGAMSKQMDTVNGAISNAGDAVDNLADKLGEAGLNSVVKNLALAFANLTNNIADAFTEGESARILERQIDTITERIFNLQAGIEDAQDNNFFEDLLGGSAENYTRQVIVLQKELDGLVSRLSEARKGGGGIDEAGKEDESGAAAIAVEQEAQKDARAYALEQIGHHQAAETALKLAAKQTEIEELAEIEKLAAEGILASRAQMDVQAVMDDEKSRKQRISAATDTIGALSSLTSASSKKMFEVGKAASIAQSIVGTHAAVVESWKNAGGYPWGVAPAAAMFAAGMVQVQNIKSQQFSGQAHDGMDRTGEGSYKLKNNEMVLDSGTSERVRRNIDNATGGGGNNITFAPVVQLLSAEDAVKNMDKVFVQWRNMFVDWMNQEGLRFS